MKSFQVSLYAGICQTHDVISIYFLGANVSASIHFWFFFIQDEGPHGLKSPQQFLSIFEKC